MFRNEQSFSTMWCISFSYVNLVWWLWWW